MGLDEKMQKALMADFESWSRRQEGVPATVDPPQPGHPVLRRAKGQGAETEQLVVQAVASLEKLIQEISRMGPGSITAPDLFAMIQQTFELRSQIDREIGPTHGFNLKVHIELLNNAKRILGKDQKIIGPPSWGE